MCNLLARWKGEGGTLSKQNQGQEHLCKVQGYRKTGWASTFRQFQGFLHHLVKHTVPQYYPIFSLSMYCTQNERIWELSKQNQGHDADIQGARIWGGDGHFAPRNELLGVNWMLVCQEPKWKSHPVNEISGGLGNRKMTVTMVRLPWVGSFLMILKLSCIACRHIMLVHHRSSLSRWPGRHSVEGLPWFLIHCQSTVRWLNCIACVQQVSPVLLCPKTAWLYGFTWDSVFASWRWDVSDYFAPGKIVKDLSSSRT